ncbi:MAG: MarR family transcriptional regulator [Cyanobacteria bacterium SZAS TMP-1]|nr:MarR family transcriptional regulator [Cyanobacteria bacterium SZAS TMP-1]
MTKSISSLEDHLGYWLRFVSNHASQAFSTKVESEGVTIAEWVVLREMFDHSSVNPSQLAERLALSRGAVSKLVDRLVSKGLVEKQQSKTISPNADGRYQTIELTRTGRTLVPKLARLADKNDIEFFGHLSTKQKKKLVLLLKEIVTTHGWKKVPTE